VLGDRPIAVLVDAGLLSAYVDADDRHHLSFRQLLETHPGPLIVPELVVTEVATLDRRHFGQVRPKHTPTFSILPRPAAAMGASEGGAGLRRAARPGPHTVTVMAPRPRLPTPYGMMPLPAITRAAVRPPGDEHVPWWSQTLGG